MILLTVVVIAPRLLSMLLHQKKNGNNSVSFGQHHTTHLPSNFDFPIFLHPRTKICLLHLALYCLICIVNLIVIMDSHLICIVNVVVIIDSHLHIEMDKLLVPVYFAGQSGSSHLWLEWELWPGSFPLVSVWKLKLDYLVEKVIYVVNWGEGSRALVVNRLCYNATLILWLGNFLH